MSATHKSLDLGLVQVTTEQLRTLLRGIHRETLVCPLTPAGLAGHGLQEPTGMILGHMRELDRASVRAVVVAVLAERMASVDTDH